MIRFLIPLILLIFFVAESMFVDLFPSELYADNVILVPRFTIIFIILIAIVLGGAQAILYGIIFGLLFDIVYTNVLGVHAFLYPLIGYLFSYVKKVFNTHVLLLFFLSILGVAILEFSVYGLYALIGLHAMPLAHYISARLIPTLVLNAVFFVLIYFPFYRFLRKIELKQEADGS